MKSIYKAFLVVTKKTEGEMSRREGRTYDLNYEKEAVRHDQQYSE